MNLNEYDNVKTEINKQKSWIDVKKQLLYSREIKYRKYFSILKKYNPVTRLTEFYIAVTNNPSETKISKLLNLDDYGRIKIKLQIIWNDSEFRHLTKDCNISVVKVQEEEDGEVYLIDY